MWKNLSDQERARRISYAIMAAFLVFGAVNNTIAGTWDEISTYAFTIYVAATTMLGGAGVVKYSQWALRRESTKELEDSKPTDKYGYLKEINWQAVARLEHEHGYNHMPESLAVCRKTECLQSWLDDMPLDEAVPELMRLATAGIISTDQLTELTGVAPDEVKSHLKNPQGRLLFDDSGRLLNPYPSFNELRAMPVSAAAPMEDLNLRGELLKQAEYYAKELPVTVLPPGFSYTPVYRQGEPTPSRILVEDRWGTTKANVPGSMLFMTAEEARERGHPQAYADRRRDAVLSTTSTAIGDAKPVSEHSYFEENQQLFLEALMEFQGYTNNIDGVDGELGIDGEAAVMSKPKRRPSDDIRMETIKHL